MPEKSGNIKNQKEKELEKNSKAPEKRRQEKMKSGSSYKAENKEKEKNEKPAVKDGAGDFAARAVSFPLFVPLMTIAGFMLCSAVCYICGYSIFSPSFGVDGLFHCLYIGDFSIGLSSRLLVGSVLSLFSDTVTADMIDIFAKVFLYLSFVLQSLLSACIIKKGLRDKNIFLILLAVLFVMNPVSVCTYARYFGVLDLFFYVVFLFAVIIQIKGRSTLQFFVAALSIAGLLIHYAYFLAFFPSLFVLGLYRTVNAEKKDSLKEAAALGVHSVLSTGMFFYLTVFAKNCLIMTSEEMLAYVNSKADKSLFIYGDYLNYYLYDIFRGEQIYDTGSSLSALVNINMELVKPDVCIKYLLLTAPLFVLYYAVCVLLIKGAKGKKRLPFIAMAAMPLALVPELILSSDSLRWITSTVLCLFTVMFALILMKAPEAEELTEKFTKLKKPLRLSAYVLTAVYMLLCLILPRFI